MTEVDVKNTEKIIELYEKYMGYDEESTKFAIEQLRNPKIDDEYAKFLGPDLRKRWEFDLSDEPEENKAYSMFKSVFHSLACRQCVKGKFEIVDESEFDDNLKVYKKNTLKIKNYMMEYYTSINNVFCDDLSRGLGGSVQDRILKKYGEKKDEFLTKVRTKKVSKEEMEEFIVKSFEVFGVEKKTKKKKAELVLSCNFADMLLSSTAENWSSCFSLTGGCYWYGVPGLIGDFNRAFLYTTRGIKKDFFDIQVDRVINRTWVLLDKKNMKNIVRFYPSPGSMSVSLIKKITGDDSYQDADEAGNRAAKHIIFPMFMSKGIYSSTSNDACRFEGKKDGLHMFIGSGGGTQYFDRDFEPFRDYNTNTISLPDIIKKGMKMSDIFTIKVCECCNSNKNLSHITLHNGRNVYLCKDCLKEYEQCKRCGKFFKKGEEKFVKYEGKEYCSECFKESFVKCDMCEEFVPKSKTRRVKGVGLVCSGCFEKNFEICGICGEITKKGEKEYVVKDGRKICASCHENRYAKCEICEKEFPKEALKKIDGVFICPNCKNDENVYKCRNCKETYLMKNILFIHDKTDEKRKKRCVNCAPKLFPKHEKCRLCGELWEPERLRADKTCPKCNGEDY